MLNNISLFETIAVFLALLALVLIVVLYFRVSRLSRFQKKFFSGRSAADLEEIIVQQQTLIEKAGRDIKKLAQVNKVLAELQQSSIHRIGVVRFNPFGDIGGDNSFALALLDGHGNGVVISSLYGRESQRIFVKSIVAGQSKSPLTEEEKQAILQSRQVSPSSSDDGEKPEALPGVSKSVKGKTGTKHK